MAERLGAKEKHLLKKFTKKVNAYTWKTIQSNAGFHEQFLQKKEFNPQIKVGINLYSKEDDSQDGIIPLLRPNCGKIATLREYLEIVQIPRPKAKALVGEPGSGKSILLTRLARYFLLANGYLKRGKLKTLRDKFMKDFRPGDNNDAYHAIFLMNVRDIPNLNDVTLADCIFNQSVTGITPEEARCGVQAIVDKKVEIIVFFDGLDEAGWNPIEDHSADEWTKTSTAAIFGNILSGRVLYDVPITVASRQYSVTALPWDLRPKYVAGLVGFSAVDSADIYRRILLDDANADWHTMCTSSTRYMWLNPLCLILYTVTAKEFRETEPEYVSELMFAIIGILFRDICGDLTIKVKQIAFNSVLEGREVFSPEYLADFGIQHENILTLTKETYGLHILRRVHVNDDVISYMFLHKVLKEVLATLYVAEMDFVQFKKTVDEEFGKENWSIVRIFACGILNNDRTKKILDKKALQQHEREAKSEYLMQHLKNQYSSQLTSAQKFHIFCALHEADMMGHVPEFTRNLDLANLVFTPATTNAFCSAVKNLSDIPSLSLTFCGVDDTFLSIFASRMRGSGIKIARLSVRDHGDWTNFKLWRQIVDNVSISTCYFEIIRNNKFQTDIDTVSKTLEAVGGRVERLQMANFGTLELDLRQIRVFVQSNVETTIKTMRILHRNPLSGDDWRQIGLITRNCDVSLAWHVQSETMPDLRSMIRSHGDVEPRRLTIWALRRSELFFENNGNVATNEKRKAMSVTMGSDLLWRHPKDLGHLIADCEFDELVLTPQGRFLSVPARWDIDVESLASGLNGFKIGLLAVERGYGESQLSDIMRCCDVQEFYIYKDVVSRNTLEKLRKHTSVTILPKAEWRDRFLK